MKNALIITALFLVSLVGYSQKVEKISISKIEKEVKKINKTKHTDSVYVSEAITDSIYGDIVVIYTLYTNDNIKYKILVEYFSKDKKMTIEEVYIKNNQVIYYKGSDFSNENRLEIYFVDYEYLTLKLNGNVYEYTSSYEKALVKYYISSITKHLE